MHTFPRLCLILGVIVLYPPCVSPSVPATVPLAATVQQAPYPEGEIVRRREVINRQTPQPDRKARDKRSESANGLVPVAHAFPLTGTLQISSGSTSTFYGKVRRELTFTIKEYFVGNLIVTRYFDPAVNRYTDREEYTIETISLEINASDFKARVCSKYSGSPPTCVQWQQLDLWQIADGEEYPGRMDGVVAAITRGNTVHLRIDGPDILFMSSLGGQGLQSGCGDLVQQQVDYNEFRRWIKRGVIRIKKEVGMAGQGQGCRPGSTVTLEMRIGA